MLKKKKKKDSLDYWLLRTGWTGIRLALSGKANGMPINGIIEVLGEEESINRLKNWCEYVKKQTEEK